MRFHLIPVCTALFLVMEVQAESLGLPPVPIPKANPQTEAKINWCIRNPLEGKELAADDSRMVALQAYITHERRGVKLEPGKH
jgi:hypothetical protein